jgi:hypothetical protein
MKIRSTRNKYRFPDYFLGKEVPFAIKVIAFLLVVIIVLLIIDTMGVTYKPKITIDAYTVRNSISPDLYGYSIDSNFKYEAGLLAAVKQYGAQSLRVMDEYEPGARMLVRAENGAYRVLASDNTPYNPNKEYKVKIKVSGNNIRVYVDDQQIFNVYDSKFSQGEIGLTSSYNLNSYFDDVTVRDSSGKVIFSDYFGSGLGKWNNGDIPGFYNQGSWSISSGRLKHYGKESITLKRAGSHSWKNYSIETKIKSTSSNIYDAGFIGIIFRYNGILNNYRFLWRSYIRQPYVTNNHWGIADFDSQLRFAKDAGLKPNMVINMRDHSSQSAANLVREMNINKKYGIKYWELGNEIWAWSDSYIHNTTYAKKIKEFSQAMKAVDPTIQIGASLLLGFSDWDIEVIKRSAKYIDFIIFHFYPYFVQSGISDNHILAAPHSFGHNYKNSYGQGKGIAENAYDFIKKYAPGHESKIDMVVTEFNTGDYEQGIDLIYGLAMADLLGEATTKDIKLMQFHKLANETGWQWGSFTADYRPKPSALAISMFTKHFGQKSLSAKVSDSPTFSVSEKYHVPSMNNVPYFTAHASRSSNNNKLYLMVINKHAVADMKTTIKIDNAEVGSSAKVYTLNGSSIHSDNKYGNNVKTSESKISNASTNFTYNFPAHSVTAIEINISKLKKPPKPPTPFKKSEENKIENEKMWYEKAKQYSQSTGGYQNSSDTYETKIVASAGFGGNPHVKSFDSFGHLKKANFFAYDGNFRGGVSVAYGDIDGDGQDEIVTGAGPGGGPHIRAFEEGGQEIANFFPFHPDFRGGINVATGDVDHDGKDEIAVSQASRGQAWVKVYNNDKERTIIGEWNTFAHVECGADVAMGDVDGDGADEIIVGAGPGGGPHIRIYEANGTLMPLSFFAFHPLYRGGISVASADVDGDNRAEIGVSQSGQEQAWTKIYRYDPWYTIVGEWKAYGDNPVGAHLGMGDIDEDGKAEVVTGTGLGGEPLILTYEADGKIMPVNFYVFDRVFIGGLDIDVKK